MKYNIYRTTGFVLHKQYQTEGEEEKRRKNIYTTQPSELGQS